MKAGTVVGRREKSLLNDRRRSEVRLGRQKEKQKKTRALEAKSKKKVRNKYKVLLLDAVGLNARGCRYIQ